MIRLRKNADIFLERKVKSNTSKTNNANGEIKSEGTCERKITKNISREDKRVCQNRRFQKKERKFRNKIEGTFTKSY